MRVTPHNTPDVDDGDTRELGEIREDDAPQPVNHTQVESRGVSSALAVADIDAIQPGARINRYMVVEVIGSGGIGIVYAAYDPDLDRKVALKLLRRSKLTGGLDAVTQRRGRLRREAVALARLSHPNVVPVYEVATFEDQIYVAMEFVEGWTLGESLAEREHNWAEIVALFVQAGRGLAAAHAADIVHRDFKPDNVRVGTDGRVRVLDFGLAGPLREGDPDLSRARVDERSSRPESSGTVELSGAFAGERSGEVSFDEAVTREGQVMGTPAYMAPEQAAGGLVDARSDQFSFCVALYEAIYKQRPFTGRHGDPERFHDLSRARSLPGYRPEDLPNEVERVILRGLSLDPRKRFADMDALLVELTSVAQGPRRLWWVPASILVLAMVAVVAFYERRTGATITCDDGHGALEGIWDPTVADELRTAVLESKQPYADDTWATVEHSLDGWAQRWQQARLHACEATHVHADQSPELLERRVACLDRQLIRVENMVTGLRRLEQRPDDMLERLTPLLGRVPSPATCGAANILERTSLEPVADADAREAQAIRERLAAVEGLTDVAEYEQAIVQGQAALERARASNFEPVIAEALLTLGLTLNEQKIDRKAAAELLQDAAHAAQRSGHERTFVRAAAAVAGNLANAQAELALAAVWAEFALAGFVRLGDDPEIEVELRTNLGHIAMARGEYPEALEEFARARELAHARGEGHPEHLRTLLAIGDVLRELGRYDESAAILERGRSLAAAKLGAKHPMVTDHLDALANVATSRNRFPEALELHRRALEINEVIHGPSHRTVAKNLNNMAICFDDTGRYAESAEALERARGILVEVVGAEHPDVAFVDVNLGSALQNLGRHGEAIVRYELALGVLEHSLGPEHMAVGVALQNLGSARAGLGDHGAALENYDRSGVVLERSLGAQHPSFASLELNRARSLQALGRHDQALAAGQRALETFELIFGHEHSKLVEVLTELSETEFALADFEAARALGERALKIVGDDNKAIEHAAAKLIVARVLIADPDASEADHARARTLAHSALAVLDGAEGSDEPRREVIEWLRAQGEAIPPD